MIIANFGKSGPDTTFVDELNGTRTSPKPSSSLVGECLTNSDAGRVIRQRLDNSHSVYFISLCVGGELKCFECLRC